MKFLGILVVGLLAAGPSQAAPVPAEEDQASAAERIRSARRTARAELLPHVRFVSVTDGTAVVDLDAKTVDEPFTSLIRAAHSAVVWQMQRTAPVHRWIINFRWNGMQSGPQFVSGVLSGAALEAMTAEQWFAQLSYNGSSEVGLIGAARWCRRGGAYQAPDVCSHIRDQAIRRDVWVRAGELAEHSQEAFGDRLAAALAGDGVVVEHQPALPQLQ